jgi:hypothetical protein
MANIFDKLNDLENAEIIFNYYVYYDPHTGSVLHIRNYEEIDLYPHIVVLSSELPEKNRNLSDYSVVEKNGEFKLTNKKVDLIKFNINEDIHMVKKIITDEDSSVFDILIKQDNQEKKFYIIMSESLANRMENLWKNKRDIIMYVTSENDPNILYSTISFDAVLLIENKSITVEFDDYDGLLPCTFFTKKIFENYKHWDMR